jgi:hypothetical protein
MSRHEYLASIAKQEKKRGNKYGAKKTVIDGITFDSQREAEVYCDLCRLEKAGKIRDFTRQRKFELTINGQRIGSYKADFAFTDIEQGGRLRVVDVKGVITRDFRRVQKIMKALYDIDVEIWK